MQMGCPLNMWRRTNLLLTAEQADGLPFRNVASHQIISNC